MYKLSSGAYTSSIELYNEDMVNNIPLIEIGPQDDLELFIDQQVEAILKSIDRQSKGK